MQYLDDHFCVFHKDTDPQHGPPVATFDRYEFLAAFLKSFEGKTIFREQDRDKEILTVAEWRAQRLINPSASAGLDAIRLDEVTLERLEQIKTDLAAWRRLPYTIADTVSELIAVYEQSSEAFDEEYKRRQRKEQTDNA